MDEKHFGVIRYYPSPGKGILVDTLGENLSMSEAEEVVRQNPPVSYQEEIVVVDQDRPHFEAEVTVTTLRNDET
ncbi:MAG: hypothetical protein V4692_06925 [Bdellovibrionota bacterium]